MIFPNLTAPVVQELLALDSILTKIAEARKHYPDFYELEWRKVNERRNALIQMFTPDECAHYEVLRAGRGRDSTDP